MRTWKKILTIMILMFVSTQVFFACGNKDPYKDMKIAITTEGLTEDNTFVLTPDAESNTFTVVATVTGVDGDISKEVYATSSNDGLLSVKGEPVFANGVTTFEFVFNVLPGDEIVSNTATILFKTKEGNKTQPLDVKLDIPLQTMMVGVNKLTIIRGQEVNLNEYPNFVTYSPANTTHKGFKTHATAILGVTSSALESINTYMDSHPGKIYIDNEATVDSFYLTVTSDSVCSITGNYAEYQVLVIVLDYVDASKFEFVCTDEVEGYTQYDVISNTLTLVINTDDLHDYHEADIQNNLQIPTP